MVAAIAPLATASGSGATGAPPDAPAGSATTYQGNALHDGYSADQFTTPLGKLWSRDFGQEVSYPLMVNDRIFVATSDVGGAYGSELWALDATDGSVLWGPISLGGTYNIVGIAADGANVYTVTYDGFLQALDQSTGSVVWSKLLVNQSSVTSPPTVYAGTLYVTSGSNSNLSAVDTETGAVNWTASSPGDHTSPAVTDDGVYAAGACEVAVKLDPATGANQWTHTTGCSGGGGRTAVVHGNSLYIRDPASAGPAILSTATGAQTGAFNSWTAPAFSADRMFTLSRTGTLSAVDTASNTIEWTQTGDGGLVTAPLVIGNAVAVGSSTGKVFLYDTTTGARLWSGNTGSPILAPEEQNASMLTGLAESNGMLLVPATNTLVAFTADSVVATPSSSAFGKQRVGTFGADKLITVANTGTTDESLSNITISGTNTLDYFGQTDCFPSGKPRTLHAGASCHVAMFFGPIAPGARHATVVVTSSAGGPPDTVPLSGTGTEGYFIAGSHGQIGTFGDAVFHGDATHFKLSAPIMSLATTPNGAGYWLLGRDGGMFAYGNARFYGSMGGHRLNKPIAAMAATPDGKGYWLVGADGGIFAFGDAHYYGSTGGTSLQKPITGMATTPTGHGYWLIASDGGVFAFGDAHFYGSTAQTHSSTAISAIIPTPSQHGYWLQAANGHLYPFGDAQVFGSAPAGYRIVGTAPTPDGHGYWQVTNTGRIFAFGDAHSYGNLPVLGVTDVIAIAATAPPLPPGLIGAAHASAHASAPASATLGLGALGRQPE